MVRKEDKLGYQLKKFEVLMKRKAGLYCLLDWQKRKIVPSGEDKKSSKNKLIGNKYEEVITWLKETNTRLQKEDSLGGKILLTYSRLGREAKRLRRVKQLKEQRESIK